MQRIWALLTLVVSILFLATPVLARNYVPIANCKNEWLAANNLTEAQATHLAIGTKITTPTGDYVLDGIRIRTPWGACAASVQGMPASQLASATIVTAPVISHPQPKVAPVETVQQTIKAEAPKTAPVQQPAPKAPALAQQPQPAAPARQAGPHLLSMSDYATVASAATAPSPSPVMQPAPSAKPVAAITENTSHPVYGTHRSFLSKVASLARTAWDDVNHWYTWTILGFIITATVFIAFYLNRPIERRDEYVSASPAPELFTKNADDDTEQFYDPIQPAANAADEDSQQLYSPLEPAANAADEDQESIEQPRMLRFTDQPPQFAREASAGRRQKPLAGYGRSS